MEYPYGRMVERPETLVLTSSHCIDLCALLSQQYLQQELV